ncbi:MAG: tetratricopeptide repeat protein [Nannocystaceae bacterium]|nr:tetratricopeptide repeat protein [Myxococcales bacterium]
MSLGTPPMIPATCPQRSLAGLLIAALAATSSPAAAAPAPVAGEPPATADEPEFPTVDPSRGAGQLPDVGQTPVNVPEAAEEANPEVGPEPAQGWAPDLYRKGREAYQLGHFSEAIERFEEAYRLAPAPDLLYNIGLAYLRRHEASHDVEDLQKARAVLFNFRLEVEKDPNFGDPSEVETLMKEIEAGIAEEEAKERALTNAITPRESAPTTSEPECKVILPEEDPGRVDRLAGVLTLGAGGLLIAGGAASLAVFTFKGQEFETTLTELQAQREVEGCDGRSSARCDALAESIDTTTANGRRANLLAAGVGTALMGAGVVGVVTGAILYARGKKRGEQWERRVQLSPTVGGLVLRGRF